MKTVLIITYYWPPSGGGGVQRWVKFVKYLQEFGIKPIILTVDSRYASYAVIDKSLLSELPENIQVTTTKSSEPFNLYKKFTSKKEIPFGGFANEANPGLAQKISRFIRGNFFIPDARVGWNSYAYKQALKLIKEYKIDTVITSSPPHSTQLIGLRLKQKLNIFWIADLRDPWTDIYYYNKMYHSFLAKKLDKKSELDVLNNADKLIVVSNFIKELFTSKLALNIRNKVNVISNGFDSDDFPASQNIDNNTFTITYTGTLADNYHIEGFLKALIIFVQKLEIKNIKLQFVGRVSPVYHTFIDNSILKTICSFEGHVSHSTSISHICNADALFLAIPDELNNAGILTGKLFEYLAARKPIIGVGPVAGDAAMIIKECNAGSMFSYNNEEGIINYINNLYSKWLTNSPTIPKNDKYKNYSRYNLTKKLVELIP